MGRFYSNYNKHLDSGINPMWLCGDFIQLVKKIILSQN